MLYDNLTVSFYINICQMNIGYKQLYLYQTNAYHIFHKSTTCIRSEDSPR